MNEIEIREKLDTYRRFKRELRIALQTLDELMSKATATGSLKPKDIDVINSLPLNARFEDKIIDKADLEAIVDFEIRRMMPLKQECMSLISHAPLRARLVLVMFYIDGLTLSQIADQIHLEVRSVKRIKSRGLKVIIKKMSL